MGVKMSIVFKLVKRIIIAIFFAIVFGVIGLLIWRMTASDAPKSMEPLDANAALCEAYEQEGDELYMFRQEQRSITSSEENYGYFAITDYAIIPDANQIQTVVRYNNSTLRHTAEDYGLSEPPSRDEEVYDVTLLFAIDLTPDDKEDNLGNDEGSVNFIRCHGEVTLTAQKNLYNFRRIVFELDDAEINISELLDSELLLAIYADFYYNEAIDYEAEPYGTLCIYDFKSANIPVKLEKHDVKAIQAFEDN